MQLTLRDSLPFVTVVIVHGGVAIEVPNVLVDTGSASTVLSAEIAETLGVVPEPADRLRTLRGVGGREVVFTRRIDRIEVAGHALDSMEVEVGAMDYGFAINGILGMDSLATLGALLDLQSFTLVCR